MPDASPPGGLKVVGDRLEQGAPSAAPPAAAWMRSPPAYPGDPEIDANLSKPDAPIPSCPSGQTWHHTSGVSAYDTPSGDLEVGQYAQQPDGSYVVHYPVMTYTSATSSAQCRHA